MTKFNLPLRFCRFACALLLSQLVLAQTAAPGVITGRILNPATGEYVRNAQVRVEGRAEAAISEGGGLFRLSGVAPGEVTVVVTYTGYQSTSAKVHVPPGATVTRDFELTSTLQSRPVGEGALIKLDAFKVPTERHQLDVRDEDGVLTCAGDGLASLH